MPTTQPSKELHALCHEHHAEMRLNQILLKSEDQEIQTQAYACPEPDCFVHYNIARGYFMLTQNGNLSELDMVPTVRCPHDEMPMYLAEINPEKRGFRLWRCPQCDGKRTNEEGLINKAP
jgi:hypothetical protein